MKNTLLFITMVSSFISSIAVAQMSPAQMEAFDQRILIEQEKQSALRKQFNQLNQVNKLNQFSQGFEFPPGGNMGTGMTSVKPTPVAPIRSCKFAVNPEDKVTPGTVALTFDDGPNPKTTPLVLDILKAHNIKATFFVLGSKIRGNEALLQRMLDEGHHIGNHSWDHPSFHTLNLDVAEKQINRTETLLSPFTQDNNFFRYPYGNSTCETNDYLKSEGYKIVGWDVDTCDWAYVDGKVTDRENVTCEALASERSNYALYVLRQAKISKGGIMLMHDIHMQTAMSLDEIITKLEAQNYRFVDLADKAYFPKLNE